MNAFNQSGQTVGTQVNIGTSKRLEEFEKISMRLAAALALFVSDDKSGLVDDGSFYGTCKFCERDGSMGHSEKCPVFKGRRVLEMYKKMSESDS